MITVRIGWVLVLVLAALVAGLLVLTTRDAADPAGPAPAWPTVVRGGVVVQPEDLDR